MQPRRRGRRAAAGKAVTREFRWQGLGNLYLLPPSAFVDVDDDANPTLKSLVLAQFAMDAIVDELAPPSVEVRRSGGVLSSQ